MLEKRIAVYIRLSSADEDTGRAKDESNSVKGQRNIINYFLDNHSELSNYPRTEFVDDGFTGTNTNRPAFQRMIADIKAGKYFCCITKDFSRFSRDYIEWGDYLEYLFPFLGVRYISINDNYDSKDYKGTTGGIDVIMRAIIYDAYSKDLSLKVKSGKAQARKKGHRNGFPAYGYKRDPNRKGMDIIDPEAAAVVRRIFTATIDGMKIGEIAQMLNDENIPTPSMYFRMKNPGNRKFHNTSSKQRWDYGVVRDILNRYTYTGAAVGGLREQLFPCKRSSVKKSREEWIIVPNMHEAIITTEEYELAQMTRKKIKMPQRKTILFPLKSLVICANCLRRMDKMPSKVFFCKYRSHEGDEECKNSHIQEPKLEQIVFQAICKRIEVWKRENKSKQKRSVSSHNNNRKNLEKLNRRIEFLKRKKFREYEQYTSGNISKERYLQNKKAIDSEMVRLQSEVEEMNDEQNIARTEINAIYSELEDICERFSNEKSLTYDMAHAFIKRILVSPNESIEIEWRYKS